MGQIEKIVARQHRLDHARRENRKKLREAKQRERDKRDEIVGRVVGQYLDRYPTRDLSVWVTSLLDTALVHDYQRTLFTLPARPDNNLVAVQQFENGAGN